MLKFTLAVGILLSFSSAFAQEMYGLFMVVKGDVKIESASKQQTAAKVGSKIKPGETIISGKDSRAKVVMSDRNVINVSPETKLVIEKYSNDATTGKKEVQMNLLEGKVRNNVEQKYDGDKAKFTLKTPTAVAGIRGTEFLTSFSSKTNQTTIVTFKGEVGVTSAAGGSMQIVKRGQSSSVSEGKAAETPQAVPAQELKSMDKESSSTAATVKKEEAPRAEADKGTEKKADDKKAETAATPDAKPADSAAPAGDKKAAAADSSSSSTTDGGKKDSGSAAKSDSGSSSSSSSASNDKGSARAPAATDSSASKGAPKMVSGADMDTSIAKQLPPPPGAPPVPVLPPPPPPTAVIPKVPDAVKQIVDKQVEKSNVTITISN